MAKAPAPYIPKTSGQGVTRYSYMKAYGLGFRGTGAPKAKGISPISQSFGSQPEEKKVATRLMKAPKSMFTGKMDAGETWETFSKRVKS
jgi:hypothetical protein